jgi:3'-5' exoribonuclease
MNPIENKKLLFPEEKKLIEDLKVGDKVDSYFRISSVDKRTKKDGNAFLSLQLMDKTGKIPAKVWNNAERFFKIIVPGDIYKLNGMVNEFMNKKEIKVDGIRALTSSDADLDETDFQESAAFDTGNLFDEMMTTLKSHLTTPCLLQLADLFGNGFRDDFQNHYGAQKIHHAYLGGLLEHTFSMMKIAIFCADHYKMDKELMVMGVLFHDIGKLYEFNIEPTVEATLEGGLLGHLLIGNGKFLELKNRIPDFPEDLSIKIQHLIISHHGEKEFGSPEVPKTPEAFLLHLIDLMDSKIQIVKEAIENAGNKGLFSDYINVLGRRLYVPPKE